MPFPWWVVSIPRLVAGAGRMGRDLMRRYFREPQLDLVTDIGDPYQQRWPDSGGQQTLWRVRVNNASLTEPRRRVQVRVGRFVPWAMHGLPAYLQVRNRPQGDSTFDLAPGNYEYVDVVQQSLPNGMLLLWHTVPHLDHVIATRPYDFTITALSDDSRPRTKKCQIVVENGVCTLRLID